ncbi:MAG: aspartate carbamoyltransferase catalytic subunit [Bacteroidota bacterium]|nr:aspartate carbamoyltransferase catalytic subunit [Bacteroidota bacterium]
MNRDLLGIRQLSQAQITDLLHRSDGYFRHLDSTEPFPDYRLLHGRTIANLFFENSTRTRTSFELAEKRLGATSISLSMQTSSLTKGESLIDTINVICAMKVDCIVVRHSSSGVPQLLRNNLPPHIRIINAGDGAHEHPTQALLDAATLLEQLGSLKGKRIFIVGDISHSRVARSNMLLLKMLGAEITLVGPETLLPKYVEEVFDVRVRTTIGDSLHKADAVIALRIQQERQSRSYFPNLSDFRLRYGLTPIQLSDTKAFILHPGPVNRSVELDDEVVDSEKSLILRQVRRGVAIRMAVLEWLFEV